MGFLGKAAATLLFGGVGALLGGKKDKPRQPRPVTRDSIQEEVQRDDELRRRRGSAADMLTATRGAEASGASIGRLVVGS